MKGFVIAVAIAVVLIVVAVIGTRPSGSMKEKVIGVWKIIEFNGKPASETRYLELRSESVYEPTTGETKVTYDDRATVAIAKRVDNNEEILRANITNAGQLVVRERHPLIRDMFNESVFEKATKEDMEKVASANPWRSFRFQNDGEEDDNEGDSNAENKVSSSYAALAIPDTDTVVTTPTEAVAMPTTTDTPTGTTAASSPPTEQRPAPNTPNPALRIPAFARRWLTQQ